MRNLRGFSFILLLFFCLCCTACSGKEQPGPAVSCEYDRKLFSADKVHHIDVTVSEADWTDLKSRPLEKIKYAADVTIDGESFRNVAFSTKGNSSLSAVVLAGSSSRFSYKISFGKFEKGQTYYGLTKLHLNSIYGDATLMKDFISYELFRRSGVSSPLISYVWLTVNSSPVGLYIAVEDMGSSFRDRALNGEGFLYKPESDRTRFGNLSSPPPVPAEESGASPASGLPAPPVSPFQGADLMYIDEKTESYPGIFSHTQTKSEDTDKQRVIQALKGFFDRRNPEDFLDTKEIIRYFAAHNFVLNGDSYTGFVPTNYILYERNGRLSLFPWDYNLAFGAFPSIMPGDSPGNMPDMAPGGMPSTAPGGMPDEIPAASPDGPAGPISPAAPVEITPEGISFLLNTGIDSPLAGVPDTGRPAWAWILSSDYFTNQYHEAVSSLVKDYFESGAFESQVDSLYRMILPYAEIDPTAFYSSAEFSRAVDVFKKFCSIRAQSIRRQLEGKLSTRTFEQKAEDRIDTSGIDMDALGTPIHDAPVPQ